MLLPILLPLAALLVGFLLGVAAVRYEARRARRAPTTPWQAGTPLVLTIPAVPTITVGLGSTFSDSPTITPPGGATP